MVSLAVVVTLPVRVLAHLLRWSTTQPMGRADSPARFSYWPTPVDESEHEAESGGSLRPQG